MNTNETTPSNPAEPAPSATSTPTGPNHGPKRSYRLTVTRLMAIGCIFIGASLAWFILGGAMAHRTTSTSYHLEEQVEQVWGAPLVQEHPIAWVNEDNDWHERDLIRIDSSDIKVDIRYKALRKGLLLYRTYEADFKARYMIPNPSLFDQVVYVSFKLPEGNTSFVNFSFRYGDKDSKDVVPVNGVIKRPMRIPAGESIPLEVTYRARGTDRWDYDLSNCERLRNFRLNMTTDFSDVDYPEGGNSPTERSENKDGWALTWDYPDVIGAQTIAMDMPKVLNAGPVASRISFFAPVSLLFFFSVLLILGVSKGLGLHPVHYFFLAAGCFTFQLLFAYTAGLMPILAAFSIASLVSLIMVGGYIRAVAGKELMKIALPAQLIYMTLFSYSFFFDGISGLCIAISSVATLAVLMKATARTDWESVFKLRKKRRTPPSDGPEDDSDPDDPKRPTPPPMQHSPA